MASKLHIRTAMEIADHGGRRIATVAELEGDIIRLGRVNGGDADAYLPVEAVERMDGNRLYLKIGTPLPAGF